MKSDQDYYKAALVLARQEPANLEGSYELLRQAKNNGDERAIYALATWYLFGNGIIEKNEKRGVDLLKSIKHANIAEVQFDLGYSYDSGRGTRKNSDLSFSFYMRAALLGDAEACSQLAQYYLEGKIVRYDRAISKSWKLRSEQSERDISPPYRVWIE